MKILFVGGGSGGPVSPLLAVAEQLHNLSPEAEFFFAGTKDGPEQAMARGANIPFYSVPAGKYRRYFSLKNLLTPFQVIAGFTKSIFLLKKIQPHAVMGAGAFVQVPVMWAARMLRIPILIHQQDVYPTLANKLCAPIANKITVTFEASRDDFPESIGIFYKKPTNKVVWTGNPFRESLKNISREEGLKKFGYRHDLPVLYVTGGGTGAAGVNKLIAAALPELSKVVQIIHQTGIGRSGQVVHDNYRQFEFIDEPGYAYAAADIVLSRAGLGTITELSNLAKISIIIPMPDSHQWYNAELLAAKQAAIVLDQSKCTPEMLVRGIRRLLMNKELQDMLSKNISHIMPPHSSEKIARLVCTLAAG